MANKFIQRSLLNAASFFKDSLYAEEYALKKGFLQKLDPRFKILTFILIILTVVITRNIPVIIYFYIVSIILAYFSKIDIIYFLKRTCIFIPFFSLFIAFPAIFNLFVPGPALFTFKIFSMDISVTKPGLLSAFLLILRVLTTVSFIVLLSLTTRQNNLLRALRIFKIPQIFIMVLMLTYHYIYILAKVAEDTFMAMRSRLIQTLPAQKNQQILTRRISAIWLKSKQLSEETYLAMLSRAFSGEPKVLNSFKAGLGDWVWASSVMAVILWTNLFLK